MGRLRPGHFTLSPTDSDGSRTFQPKVVSSSDGGELTYYFTAEVVMSEEAYRRMALDKGTSKNPNPHCTCQNIE
jgi:hypothetical protein